MTIYQGPWTSGESPVAWAERTGRITAKSRGQWQALYTDDPVGVGRTLAGLAPVVADQLDTTEPDQDDDTDSAYAVVLPLAG